MRHYYVHLANEGQLKTYKNGNTRLFVNYSSSKLHKDFQRLVIAWLRKKNIQYTLGQKTGMWRTIGLDDASLAAVRKQFPRGRFTPVDYNVTLPPPVAIPTADQFQFYIRTQQGTAVTGRQVVAWLKTNKREYVSYTNFADRTVRKKYIVSKDTLTMLILFFPEIKLVVIP